MQSQVFRVKFIPNKTCFLYFTTKWTNSLQNSANAALQVIYNTNDRAYFSWSTNHSLSDNEVGINAAFAKLLNINEDDELLITVIKEVVKLKRIVVTPISHDDWELLEMNAEIIQSTLLNYLTTVFINEKFLIWVSKSMSLCVQVDSLNPISQVGHLENFTEVEIIPIKSNSQLIEKQPIYETNEWSWSKSLSNLINKKNTAITKSIDIFNKYSKLQFQFACNVSLIKSVDKLSITDETKTILEHPFNVYIYKKHLPEFCSREKTKFWICQLNIIIPPNSDSDNSAEIIVNLVVIDDFELIPQNLFPKFNHCTVVVGENLQKFLNLTDKCKILLNSYLYEHSDVSEIQIQPISNLENVNLDNFTHSFKLYVLERSKYTDLLLISNSAFKISDSLSCYLKFLPAKNKYLRFNGDILRNVKISARNDLVDSNKFKLTSSPNQSTDSKIDFIYLEKFLKVVNSGVKTLRCSLKLFEELKYDTSIQNILISGQTGSGKSVLGKLICKQLLDETNFVYTKTLDCKSLKGKKSETVQKLLIQHFDECLYFQPSIIFLDDLDIICGNQNESSDGIISSETNYFNKMSEMLHILIKTYQLQNFICIIATIKSKNNLNKILYNPRGNHLFSTHLETPILESNDRKEIMKHILQEINSNSFDDLIKNGEDLHDFNLQTEGYVFQDFVDFKNKCIFESIKRDIETSQKENKYDIKIQDVQNALKNVVPISFHDINLQNLPCRRWNEIGGLHSAKEALIETIQWPNLYPEIFSTCPIRLQTGILLFGHPGTGKTILAGAAAHYFGLRLISIKGPELLSKYIGASEESVRNIFQKAESAKPCILFFDEFDSLAPRRGHDSTGVTDRVVNQLLTQLDGVETLDGVYVMAATSRPDLIDPALLRPGRLGRQIHCSLPNPTDRLDILKLLSKNLTLDDNISLNEISKATKGFTGADLQAILCTAQLSAIEDVINSKDDKTEISVKISQRHLLASLKQTRPSLSVEEKARYDKIYAVFQGKEEKSKGAIRKQKVTLA